MFIEVLNLLSKIWKVDLVLDECALLYQTVSCVPVQSAFTDTRVRVMHSVSCFSVHAAIVVMQSLFLAIYFSSKLFMGSHAHKMITGEVCGPQPTRARTLQFKTGYRAQTA